MELNRAMRLIEGARVEIETHEGVLREGRVTEVRRRTVEFVGLGPIEIPEGVVLDGDPGDVVPVSQIRSLTCNEVVAPDLDALTGQGRR